MALFKIISIQPVAPTAINAATQAAIAKILSSPPMVGAAAAGMGAGRIAETGAGPRCCAVEEIGAAAVRDGGCNDGASGAPLDAPVGPPGGSVGSLIVGAAVGLGGRLMRTVSFFGWTRPVVFFIGGMAPDGAPGFFGGKSAIILLAER